jgi:hypothetical protein
MSAGLPSWPRIISFLIFVAITISPPLYVKASAEKQIQLIIAQNYTIKR